jgi:hypothetical protein
VFVLKECNIFCSYDRDIIMRCKVAGQTFDVIVENAVKYGREVEGKL